MDLLLKLVFFTIEFMAMVMLSLASFRLQIRYSLHKVFTIALVSSIVSIYIREILNESTFALIPTFVSEIVMLVVLFRLPILFSFLVALIGTLAGATIETFFIWLEAATKLFSIEEIQKNPIPVQLPTTLVILILMSYLLRRKIGFHFTLRDSLRGYNFYLSAVLVIAVVLAAI
ncbi:hypothetical protein LJK88_34415 [Paenibacillus sp. P26]|nr:hypothetical protein LJK88_34415 [Paenibacillus sp. P26]